MDGDTVFREEDMKESFWGLGFGMKPSDVFRSGAGMDERSGCGSVTLARVYPRRDLREPSFTDYEALFDEGYGLFGISARSRRKGAFDLKLAETCSRLGTPLLFDCGPDGKNGRTAIWNCGGGMVMLEERTGPDGEPMTEISCSSASFPDLWDGRNGRAKS